MVAIVPSAQGESNPGVESADFDPHSSVARDRHGISLKGEQAVAIGDPELDHRDGIPSFALSLRRSRQNTA